MSRSSFGERCAVGFALTTVLAAGAACTTETTDPSVSEVSEGASNTLVLPNTQPAVPDDRPTTLHVYPTTVLADGFEAVEADAEELAAEYAGGWAAIQAPLGNNAAVTVVVHPEQEVSLPGITALPNFCDYGSAGDFGKKLEEAILGDDGIPDKGGGDAGEVQTVQQDTREFTVIVTEQVLYPKCPIAYANRGKFFDFDSSTSGPRDAAHEIGHAEGYPHDGAVSCDSGAIDASCVADEYGNRTTVMGWYDEQWPYDKDLFTAAALYMTGRIPAEQIHALPATLEGESRIVLSALQDLQGGGVVAARIPLTESVYDSVAIGTQALPDAEASGAEVTATAVYIEYSGGPNGLSIKAVATNETGVSNTYLLPFTNGARELSAADISEERDIVIGGKTIRFHLYSLSPPGQGQAAEAEIGISIL